MALSCTKKQSVFLREIMSKHHSDFYCLNPLYSFGTKNKLESHKNVCENKDFSNTIMPYEDTKILEFHQYQKSDKTPFVIYVDLKCLIENINGIKNNLENSFATRISEHIPPGFSVSAISSFQSIENKLDVNRVKDCMKKFVNL